MSLTTFRRGLIASSGLFLLAIPAPAQSSPETGQQPLHRSSLAPASSAWTVEDQWTYGPSSVGGPNLELGVQTPNLIWEHVSDGSWIAEAVSLGNEGTETLFQHGVFERSVRVVSTHGADPQTPLVSHGQSEINAARSVSVSEQSSIYATSQLVQVPQTNQWRLVLETYSHGSAGPNWVFESPITHFTSNNSDHLQVHVSDDGGRVALVDFDQTTFQSNVFVFDASSNVPVLHTTTFTLGPHKGSSLSGNGRILALMTTNKLAILDLEDGSLAHSAFAPGISDSPGLATSADGRTVAYGARGYARVLVQDELGVFTQTFEQTLAPNEYCRRVDLSDDGGVLVCGVQELSDVNLVRFLAVDHGADQILHDESMTGAGTLPCLIQDIRCSADGSLIAAGLWGDEADLIPEVLALEVGNPIPVLEVHLPGSVHELDLAPDGRHVAVASKGTHMSVWGGAGAFGLYRVGATQVEVIGEPVAGNTVGLLHHMREGQQGRVLISTGLAVEPSAEHGYGSGLLFLDPNGLVELPLTVGGIADTVLSNYTLGAAGSEVYMQAHYDDMSELGTTWIKVSVAP